jgi:hypothetical protein
MKRKVFMVIFILVILIIGVFLYLDGTFLKKEYKSVYQAEYIESLDKDLEKIATQAMTAASSHNMQPWLIRFEGDSKINLYADMNKTLSVIDQDNKQLLISLGAYLGAFEHYADQYGYEATLEFADIDWEQEEPYIASVVIQEKESKEVDSVSSSTAKVNLNQRSDLDLTMTSEINGYENLTYLIIQEGNEFASFQELLLEATKIESNHEAATKELLNIFRWTEKDKNEYKYGLTLTSLPGILKPFVQPIMKYTAGDWKAFGQSSIQMFEERLKEETAYVVVKTDMATEEDYIHCGMFMQKVSYKLNGYYMRPAVQLLQDIDGMEVPSDVFEEEFMNGEDALIILGFRVSDQDSYNPNPRHLLEEILIEE